MLASVLDTCCLILPQSTQTTRGSKDWAPPRAQIIFHIKPPSRSAPLDPSYPSFSNFRPARSSRPLLPQHLQSYLGSAPLDHSILDYSSPEEHFNSLNLRLALQDNVAPSISGQLAPYRTSLQDTTTDPLLHVLNTHKHVYLLCVGQTSPVSLGALTTEVISQLLHGALLRSTSITGTC